jgi:hypothetical protein
MLAHAVTTCAGAPDITLVRAIFFCSWMMP